MQQVTSLLYKNIYQFCCSVKKCAVLLYNVWSRFSRRENAYMTEPKDFSRNRCRAGNFSTKTGRAEVIMEGRAK